MMPEDLTPEQLQILKAKIHRLLDQCRVSLTIGPDFPFPADSRRDTISDDPWTDYDRAMVLGMGIRLD
jgi:hypothetical protein